MWVFPRCSCSLAAAIWGWAALRYFGDQAVCDRSDHHRTPAPRYHSGQRVWLSTHDLPLQVESLQLSSRFIGLFSISMVNSSNTACLHLPRTLRVHPTVHVSRN
ncbi:hypothetical protein DPEC_G00188290 [Dallia pectoralis]|uniref:Uncharacterized protein n=1 Tax=Dallia pectoralis TaxID=75939 RepID=A0ACC2GBU8_DALPE|nr:hypothetical protein DPEC_G00188290 [Dallia pectoralis]